MDNILQAALNLTSEMTQAAGGLSDIDTIEALDNNIRQIKRTLYKENFFNNIEFVLKKYNFASLSIHCEYTGHTSNATIEEYFVETGIFLDGTVFDSRISNAHYAKKYHINFDDIISDFKFDLLSGNLVLKILDGKDFSVENLSSIEEILFTKLDREILQYFKIKNEQQALNAQTPHAQPLIDTATPFKM